MSLNGSEIIDGGNIIMPALSRTLAMTMSTSRKGMNKRQPISNAVRNSLIMNAGMTMYISICRRLLGGSTLAISTKRAKSLWRLWRSMNSLRLRNLNPLVSLPAASPTILTIC